ncbi:MAG: ABC transporter ATP-binding protein/permease [Actinomycetota bacterium]|nr:ABC transporter ATP-binding protein/permease [Actinomycetota bacterium]
MSEQRTVFFRGLRIIRGYIATHPLPFTVAVTGAAIYAGATVASTIVLGRITDDVVTPAFRGGVETRTVVWGVVAILAVGLIRAGGIVLRRYFAGMTGFRMARTLRTRVVDRYRELPLAFHQAHPTGELLAHAEADVEAATEVINPLPYSTAVILLIVFATVSLVLTDPFLAIIGLAVLPGLAFLNRVYTRKVEGPATRAQQKVGEVASVAHESLDGALVVKTLGRERAEVERLAVRARELRDERIEMGRYRAGFEPFFEALPNFGIVVLLAVGAWRISTGAITTGTLVQFISLFLLLAFPMRLIGFVLSDIPRAVVGMDRLVGVFEERLTLDHASEALTLPEGPLGLSVGSVSFGYGDNPVLSDVSFEVAPNESVAIVGPTGGGKSTLAQLLVRLADPESGSVRIGGVDLPNMDAAELRRSVAVVFQESFLFATSVRENIALDLDVPDEEIRRVGRLTRADEFVSALPKGYDTVVGERGITLSGGQRQRIALARALVRRPRLLILDDATSAVDPTVEAEILRNLMSELETTLVVVAYRVSTIAMADRVLWLEGGRIEASGSHRELLSHPAYQALVRAYERGAA